MRARPRSVHQMQASAAKMALAAPAIRDIDETCSVSAVVPTAPDHQLRRPAIMRAAYATAPAMPKRLPMTARSKPSAANKRRTRGVLNPTARRRPTSRARCSTPSRKKSAASTSADATRKKLK